MNISPHNAIQFLCHNHNEPNIYHNINKNNKIELLLHGKMLYFCSVNCYKSFRSNHNKNNPQHKDIENLFVFLEYLEKKELSEMFDQLNVDDKDKNKDYDNMTDDDMTDYEDCNYDSC